MWDDMCVPNDNDDMCVPNDNDDMCVPNDNDWDHAYTCDVCTNDNDWAHILNALSIYAQSLSLVHTCNRAYIPIHSKHYVYILDHCH